MERQFRLRVVIEKCRRRLSTAITTTTTITMNVLNPAIASPGVGLVYGAISEARYVPQYVHDSVSNMSHLPAVNYWVQ